MKTIKKSLKYCILFLIQLIESYEYRNLDLDEDDISKKIIESVDISDQGLMINTDTGYKKVSHIHKTQPYKIYKLKTETGKFLECADNHIVFREDMSEVFVKDLCVCQKIWTKDGLEEVLSIDSLPFKVSMYDITVDDSNHRFYSNDILSHNTIMSSFYIMWYACFNVDRNILVVANKEDTTKEIINKIQAVYDHLPFFLKPGLTTRNVKSLVFDNECRIVGQATTATAGVSFTIHLLYADEFAHIPENIKKQFYRSVIPTLSSSKISGFIITSTPNGQDLFYKLFTRAVPWKESTPEIKKTKPVVSLITYWDAPDGRGEEFKQQQIELLGGSIEDWNQEFECSFLKTDDLFLDTPSIRFLDRIKTKYEYKQISTFEEKDVEYRNLIFDPAFNIDNILDTDRFLISVDTAEGVGRDYFTINIFKIEPLSQAKIRKIQEYNDETDFFRLRQVGLFRSNTIPIEDSASLLNLIVYDFFNAEQVRIIVEMNYKGDIVVQELKKNKNFFEELLVHYKHSDEAVELKPGLKLNKRNKLLGVNSFRGLFRKKRIIFNEETTISEAKSFGRNKNGTFSAQSGNDDLIMSCVNIASFFGTTEHAEMIEDVFEFVDSHRQSLIFKKIEELDKNNNDLDYYEMMKDK